MFNVNRACFPKEKHQNSQKWAKFMNFSFWPFLWFGLLGRFLKVFSLFYTVEAWQTRVCLWDKPGFVPGTKPGAEGRHRKVYVNKVYVPFSLAIFFGETGT